MGKEQKHDHACDRCRYFDHPGGFVDGFGYCRRYPPVVVSALCDVVDRDGARLLLPTKAWDATQCPIVDAIDWCGEWEANASNQ